MTIACTHPGKHGDSLYALPAIRALAEKHQSMVDFYTSPYCEPLRSLFEAQDCIANFYVAPNYVVQRMDMGVQPWYVPIDASQYQAVYQLGFREIPDISIPDYIAREAGVTPKPVRYDVPELPTLERNVPKEFIVLAPRGETSYKGLFQKIIKKSPYPVVVVGGGSDGDGFSGSKVTHATGESYLMTAALIAKSKGFVGLMSSQLVLANGFPIPRICPHDGQHWNMDHVIRSKYNHYPVNPTAEEVLALLDERKYVDTYCKTIELSDYDTSDLYQHIANMRGIMSGTFTPWQTEHRRWEYSQTLKALRENGSHTVLDVGGGSSLFAAAAIWAGMDVTVVDPEDYSAMFAQQSQRIGKTIPFLQMDFFNFPVRNQFDAVTCISVIEHVEDYVSFFIKLLHHVKPGGLLCITTDFSPQGVAVFGGHLRTFNADMMMELIRIATRQEGFEVFGGKPNYEVFEQHVHGLYSFSSLVMRRKK